MQSPQNLENVTQNDIDEEQGIIRIRGAKDTAQAHYKLKPQTAEMLKAYLDKHNEKNTHSHNPQAISQVWI